MFMYYVFIILHKHVQLCDLHLQESDVFPCLCGWMVAMMDAGSHDQFIENHGKSVWTWGSKHFDKILNIYLDQNWISTFATGLNIFLPVSFYLNTEPVVAIPVL